MVAEAFAGWGSRPDVFDQFGRTVASGWGTADSGQAWTVTGTASDFAVSGGQGRIAPSATDSSRHALAVMTTHDVDVSCDVSIAQAPTGADELVFVAARSNAAATARYRVALTFATAGTLTATIQRVSGGTATTLGTMFTGSAFTAAAPWRVRLQCIGSTVRAKVWLVGTAEPASWTSAVDTVITDGGYVGCQVYRNVGNTSVDPMVFFDNFSCRALHPNVVDSFGRTVAAGGWGASDSGHGYVLTGTAADFSVSGGLGRIAPSATNSSRIAASAFTHVDCDVVCDVGAAQIQTGANSNASVSARRSASAETDYRVAVAFSSSSGLAGFTLQKVVAGSVTNLVSNFAAPGYAANQMFRIRLQCVGASIRAKAWAVGDPEPETWQASVTDSEVASGSVVALRAFRNTSNTSTDPTVLFDNFFVRPLRPAINDAFDRTAASGWGNLTSGQAWTCSNTAVASVGSGRGVQGPAANNRVTCNIPSPAVDFEARARIDIAQTPTGDTMQANLWGRATDTGGFPSRLAVTATFATGGTVGVSLFPLSGGSSGLIAAGTAYTPGTGINLRLRCVGSKIGAKAWFVGQAEPAWTEITDTGLTAAGFVHCATIRPTGNTSVDPSVYYDDFQVIDLSRPLRLDTGSTGIDLSRLVAV